MIRYALKCDDGHAFFSWFQSADAFDTLERTGHLACPDCGSDAVAKAVMAPQVATARAPALAEPETPAQAALANLRREIESKSDYVGRRFATEARAMHDGDSPRRSIWGEARLDEARALVEDGVPVAPLPFVPKARTN